MGRKLKHYAAQIRQSIKREEEEKWREIQPLSTQIFRCRKNQRGAISRASPEVKWAILITPHASQISTEFGHKEGNAFTHRMHANRARGFQKKHFVPICTDHHLIGILNLFCNHPEQGSLGRRQFYYRREIQTGNWSTRIPRSSTSLPLSPRECMHSYFQPGAFSMHLNCICLPLTFMNTKSCLSLPRDQHILQVSEGSSFLFCTELVA